MFWYRTSPAALIAVGEQHPADGRRSAAYACRACGSSAWIRTAGWSSFTSIPPQVESGEARAAAAIDWTPLFEAAGLTRSTFHEVASRWTRAAPPTFDARGKGRCPRCRA